LLFIYFFDRKGTVVTSYLSFFLFFFDVCSQCVQPCSRHNADENDELLSQAEEGNGPSNNYGTMHHNSSSSSSESDDDTATQDPAKVAKATESLEQWLNDQSSIASGPGNQAGASTEAGGETSLVQVENADPRCCIVCLDQPRQTVFRKCGHMCLCAECAKKLKKCPICQRKGKAIKVYLA
jgi:hypothetical protein